MATDVIKPVNWLTRNYLKLFKYAICTILGILFYVAAFVMLQFSTLFQCISEKLKTAGNKINLAASPVKQRSSTETREEGVQTDSKSNSKARKNEIKTDYKDLQRKEQEIQTDYTVDSDNKEKENETHCTSYSDAREEETESEMDTYTDKMKAVTVVCDNKIPTKQMAIKFIKRTLQCNINIPENNVKFNKCVQNNGKSMNSVNNGIIIEEKQTIAKNDTHVLKGETKPSEKNDCLGLPDFSENKKLNTEYHYQGHLKNHDNIEKRKPRIDGFPYSIKSIFDVSSLSSEYSLAYFISEDLQIFNGVYSEFKSKIGGLGVLMDQQLRVGEVGEIVQNEQYLFYLVINKIRTNPVLLFHLERSLNNLYEIMNRHGLKKLVISKPIIDFNLSDLKKLVLKVFGDTDIEIFLSSLPQKCLTERHNVSRIKKTTKNLWEMEYQTDRIMLINLEKLYFKNWYDEVVENINAVFPFKDKFLKDIELKPLTAGDSFIYKIDNEVLICIFIRPNISSFYKCIENAYKKMQSELTGYRYFAFQHMPKTGFLSQKCFHQCLFLIQSTFSGRNAEIWVCGTYEDYDAYCLNQFNKKIESYKNEHCPIPHGNSRCVNKLEKKEIQHLQ